MGQSLAEQGLSRILKYQMLILDPEEFNLLNQCFGEKQKKILEWLKGRDNICTMANSHRKKG